MVVAQMYSHLRSLMQYSTFTYSDNLNPHTVHFDYCGSVFLFFAYNDIDYVGIYIQMCDYCINHMLQKFCVIAAHRLIREILEKRRKVCDEAYDYL